MQVVLDEDVPRVFGKVLKGLGFDVIDIRDENLRGASDEAIFRFGQKRKALLMTGDLGFTNPTRFRIQNIQGILLNRLPQMLPLETRTRELEKLLRSVEKESLIGFITVFEVGRIRQRPLAE